jgi:predicted enzyme related to lactoylglutathione lyase
VVRPARHGRRDDARTFYAEPFGWLISPDDDRTRYASWITNDGGPWAGISAADNGRPSRAWVPYVVVEDVSKTRDDATSLGAKVVQDVTEGPGGTSVLLEDPTGALLAVFVPADH